MTNGAKAIPELVVTASISAGLALIISVSSIIYSILALIFRYECAYVENLDAGWNSLWTLILRNYILEDACSYSVKNPNITSAESVFIMIILTLCFAVLNLCAALTITAVVRKENNGCVDLVSYVYIGTNVALLVVDITLGAHFGKDHTYLTDLLNDDTSENLNNSPLVIFRLGMFLLMSICLKGYIGHAINVVLLITLIFYLIENRQKAKENGHSIHKLGPLNGYEVPRPTREESPWQQQRNELFLGYPRTNINPVYNNDEISPSPPQRQIRENPLPDYSNSPYRSDPWSVAPKNSNPPMGSRPFTYLEEPKRPIPVKPPVTPPNDQQWRRDPWPPAPPVPEPDYSPKPRKLKSALKTY
ncbi:hypothetical protein KGM_201375 [Danaus plexippus plexippus]|uniref:Uncharacterized protein n=1 Tax=Danaus plexippus plexippus TaxID=278856 RepID=A0A212FHI6_DANPL|nr:hypothetical protein KGM_201375 [Danaus plexippus plexippus]